MLLFIDERNQRSQKKKQNQPGCEKPTLKKREWRASGGERESERSKFFELRGNEPSTRVVVKNNKKGPSIHPSIN